MKLFSRNKPVKETENTGQPSTESADSNDTDNTMDDKAVGQDDQVEQKKSGLFSRLSRTRGGLFGGITNLFSGERVDESVFEEIEDQLLVADVGVSVAGRIVERLRKQAGTGSQQQVIDTLREVMLEIVGPCEVGDLELTPARPTVLLMVGVNGVGKTTTLAKLASKYKNQGRRVVLAACDTFRAAAIEQLQSWGQRLDIPVIAQSHGADAAAVAFDAYSAAMARKTDILLIDTAGRQHTHGGLVEQLKKVSRVLGKADPGLPDQVWLTVDAGNGQNVLSQVAHFHEAMGLTGLCVTKLDGTARGGVLLALADRFKLPIYFIGTGESADDLHRFSANEFVEALLPEIS